MRKERTYVYAIDTLRVTSILAVVLVHTTTKTLERIGYNLYSAPWTLFFNQFARFAVPLFIMISGFVLELNYHSNTNIIHYFKKRLSKIFVPYVFWSFIYYYFVYTQHSSSLLSDLLSGNASYQLYFIPALIIFYVAFPFLHKFYSFLSNKWFLIALSIFEFVVLYRDYYVINFNLDYYVLDVALFNIFFFVYGMVAARNREKIITFVGKFKYFFVALTITLALVITGQGRDLYYKTYNIKAFYSNWRPLVMIYTLFFAGICFYLFRDFGKFGHLIKALSRLSFFVFFVHVIVLEIVWKIIGIHLGLWYDLSFFLIVSMLSFVVAFIVHRIPYFSKVTG